jgi:hypothetical protein
MTDRTIYQNDAYSKKELIEIIAEIDADKNQMKNQAEKSNPHRKDKYSYSLTRHGETR